MKLLTRLFNNRKPVAIAVLVFVLLFASYQAFAGEFEVGPTFTSEFNGGAGLTYSQRVMPKLDLGVSLISSQEWDDGRVSIGNNGNVWLAFVAERPASWRYVPHELTIGPSVWIKTQSPINGCVLGYTLGFKYRFGDWGVGWRHWSNAGTCKPNRGQDLLVFSRRF